MIFWTAPWRGNYNALWPSKFIANRAEKEVRGHSHMTSSLFSRFLTSPSRHQPTLFQLPSLLKVTSLFSNPIPYISTSSNVTFFKTPLKWWRHMWMTSWCFFPVPILKMPFRLRIAQFLQLWNFFSKSTKINTFVNWSVALLPRYHNNCGQLSFPFLFLERVGSIG